MSYVTFSVNKDISATVDNLFKHRHIHRHISLSNFPISV